MRDLRGRLPGEEQGGSAAEGDQHGVAAAVAGTGERELGVLPEDPGTGPEENQDRQHPAAADPGAVVRVLGRVFGLRRDAVSEAGVTTVRGPGSNRKRDGMLFDLRRKPADDTVGKEWRRARAGMVQLAVRGQRGVRAWVPAID